MNEIKYKVKLMDYGKKIEKHVGIKYVALSIDEIAETVTFHYKEQDTISKAIKVAQITYDLASLSLQIGYSLKLSELIALSTMSDNEPD